MKILIVVLMLIQVVGIAASARSQPQQIAILGTGKIQKLVWSPVGSVLAAQSSEGVWLFNPDQPDQAPERLQEAAQDIAFSPDGQYLACAMGDSIRIWNLQARTNQTIAAEHMASAVAYSPDGKLMAWGGQNGKIQVWDQQKNQAVLTLSDNGVVTSLRFGPDDAFLYSQNDQHKARQWNLKTSRSRLQLGGVALSPDGKLIISGATVINTQTAQQVASLSFPNSAAYQTITTGAFSSDGKLLALAGNYGAVGLWDVQTFKVQKTTTFQKEVKDPDYRPTFIQAIFGPDSQRIALLTDEGLIYIWDIKSDATRLLLTGNVSDGSVDGSVIAVAFSPDGKLLASENFDRVVWLWNVKTHQPKHIFVLPDSARQLVFSTDSKLLAVATLFSGVEIWDTETGTFVKRLGEESGIDDLSVEDVAFSPKDSLLASAGHTSTQIWNWQTGELVKTIDTNVWGCVAFNPKGDLLAVESQNFHVWDMTKQAIVTSMDQDALEPGRCAVAFSPDGHLLGVLKHGGLSLLDTDTWMEKSFIHLHYPQGDDISFSADSKLVATNDEIWDVATGQSVAQLERVTDIRFAPNDTGLMAVADYENHLGLWQFNP